MEFDFYYKEQAEQFIFYRIPKVLFTDNRFKNMPSDAKILYGLMLDRIGLSVKNNWVDEEGRVFIIFTINDIKEYLQCSNDTATKLKKNLIDFGLIEYKKRGQGKPDIIYVKNFIKEKNTQDSEFQKAEFKNSNKQKSRVPKSRNQESQKTECNNNKDSKTYFNDHIVERESRQNTIKEIVDYLNLKTKKNFKAGTKATQRHISARLEEGYSLEDFKCVIDKKVKEWLGTDMDQYLRPETLFGTKFEGYLNQSDKPASKLTQQKPKNKFHNFEQREYDYEALEQRFMNKIAGIPNGAGIGGSYD